jgi:intracellular sulfur oxidation DsrE/DsrF family protein
MQQSILRGVVAVSLALLILPAIAASRPIIEVETKHDIRVAYEIKDDVWEAGVGKALFYIRGLIEAYDAQGVPAKELHVSAVLHGPAAYWVLKDSPYRTHKNQLRGNPNKKVISELLAHGISVEVCNATLKAHGWRPDQVLPGIKIVHDAYTRLIDLQQRGYGYIRF